VSNRTVSEYRLDTEDAVLRYREGGQTNSVRTFSLDGLVDDMTWRQKPLTHALFDQSGKALSPGSPEMTHVVARDGTVFTAVNTNRGIEVRRRGARPRSWTVGTPQMAAAAIAPSGRTVLTQDGDLIDVPTGRRTPAIQGEDMVHGAAFSPDGRYLAVAAGNGRLSLWDTRGRQRIAVLVDTDDDLEPPALAFSSDGSLFAAGAEGGSVRVWETASPRLPPLSVPVGGGPVLAVGFTSDNGELRVATPHLAARSYPLAPERAAATVCARADGGATEGQWRTYLPGVAYRRTC
jgi:WD40 repeat protein